MTAAAPDIGAMLHAAANGVPHQIQVTPPGGPPQGAPQPPAGVQPPIAPSQPGGQQAFDTALTKLLDDLHAIVGLADDPMDRQELTKCLQVVTSIQAAEQKESDAALGGKVSPRLMRKAYGSG